MHTRIISKSFVAIILAVVFFAASCKKKKDPDTSCPSILYGSSFPTNTLRPFKTDIGILDLSAKKFASYATIPFANSDRQSCFNSDDKCYYIFQTYLVNFKRNSVLYKIEENGSVSAIKTPDSSDYGTLVYNQNIHKFYCIRNNKIGEITINGSSFIVNDIARPIHSFIQNSASIAVDNTTGDMYYVTADSANAGRDFFIEKYNPGSTQHSVLSGINPVYREDYQFWGFHYNKHDKMLYAVKCPKLYYASTIIKINPASGTTLEYNRLTHLDTYYLSSCIDPCNNSLILSIGSQNWDSSFLYKFDLNGNTETIETLAGIFIKGLNFR